MTTITQALSAALLHFVWQGMVVALLLRVALVLLRKRSPNTRYLAACSALALMAALPAITIGILYQRPASPIMAATTVTALSRTIRTASAPLGSTWTQWLRMLQMWALPVWSLGVLAFSVRLAWGWKQVSALQQRGEAAGDAVLEAVRRLCRQAGIRWPVRAMVSSISDSPSVVGWIRPVILLPAASLAGLTPEQLEAVLAHEIAHIRRHDYLVNLFQIVIETVLFYHPAVWWASSRIRHERELCCDDLAVSSCGDPVRYARALTILERLRTAAPAMALGATDGALSYRIQRLVGMKPEEQSASKAPALVALTLGLACMALNIHWAQGQEAPAPARTRIGVAFTVGDHDGVTVDVGNAVVLHRTPVEYPGSALERGIQGTVTVQVNVDDSGNVVDATVVSGPPELRRSTLASILNWHFAPGGGNQRLVNVGFQLPARNTEAAGPATLRSYVGGERAITVTYRPRGEMSGYRVQHIYYEGVSDETRSALASSLPIHLGDTITHDMIEETTRAVLNLKEHVDYDIRPLENGLADILIHPLGGSESRERGSQEMVGRKVSAIEIRGLTEAGRAELRSRIPLKEGQIVSAASIDSAREALRAYDEHLELNFEAIAPGQVALVITAPEEGRVR